jgi:hypothetical protein
MQVAIEDQPGLVVRIAATGEGQIWAHPASFQSFANCSEVAGNSRIKMGWHCKTGLGISMA